MNPTTRKNNLLQNTAFVLTAVFIIAVFIVGCAAPPTNGGGTANGNAGGSSGTAGTGGAGNAGGTGTAGGIKTSGTYMPSNIFDPAQNVNAKTFKDEQELRAFLKSSGVDASGGGYGESYGAGTRMLAFASDAVAAPSAVKMSASAGSAGDQSSYSTTNNQVAGVDEGDIIKTDGNYIYTITGNTLFIVKAVPGEDASVIKTIEFKSAPMGLFIDGNRLAVFGNFYDLDYFKKVNYVPRNGMTFFTIYDVTDKENPTVVKEYKFEGSYLESRMKDDYAYMVVVSSPTLKEPMPILFEGDVKRTMAASDIAYYPIPYDNVQYASVHSINIKTATSGSDNGANRVTSKAVAVSYDNKVYMSDKNLFITSTENINEWEIRQDVTMDVLASQLTESDKDLIQKIKNTDDDVLSQAEKRSKIFQIYSTYAQYLPSDEQQAFQDKVDTAVKKQLDKYEALTYTVITRIAVDGSSVSVESTGKVPGNVLNQFSMDEYNNVFRIATTIQPRWWWPRPMMLEDNVAVKADIAPSDAKIAMPPRPQQNQPTNNIYLLDKNLEMLGKVTDIAPGETIQSARFIGSRLYLVTYKQVDPFFVFDLSDPRNPKELGKLKIPGFSRYLHPYDATHIIGIGRDASDTGRQTGLKISLFDVSDVEKPTETAKWVANDDYSQSTAEWEHKAFLFDKEKKLLVIPAYSYSYNTFGGHQNYNGAMVFKITSSDITLRGVVDHSQGTQNWGPMVERSLWIGDLLYTKSPNLLRVNNIDDLKSVKNVSLSANNQGPIVVY